MDSSEDYSDIEVVVADEAEVREAVENALATANCTWRSSRSRRGPDVSRPSALAWCGSRCRLLSSRRRLDLERQARVFAGQLSEALNGTVTDGLRLTVFMDPIRRAVIGNRVNKRDLIGDPVALTVTRAPAQIELHLLHTLDLDESRQFLTTNKSTYTLRARFGPSAAARRS